jgi:hypothetical protein
MVMKKEKKKKKNDLPKVVHSKEISHFHIMSYVLKKEKKGEFGHVEVEKKLANLMRSARNTSIFMFVSSCRLAGNYLPFTPLCLMLFVLLF